MINDLGAVKYNMDRMPSFGADVSAISGSAVTTGDHHQGNLSAENPMVWLVGIGAVTLGLVAFSTHVRIGKFSASATAG
jgi:hypothetical protein